MEYFSVTTDAGLLSHDCNEQLGNVKVQAFQEKYPEVVQGFKEAWIQYMEYCYEAESGQGVGSVGQSQPTSALKLIELDRDVKGYPLVPASCDGDTLVYMKKIV